MFIVPHFFSFRNFPAQIFFAAFTIFLLGSGDVFAQRPLGIDVSSYQGSTINWTNVKSSGVSFAWAKATEGVTVTDGDFAMNALHA